MAEVRGSVLIAAPVEAVWALATDPRRLGEWVTIHRAARGFRDGPPRTGDAFEQTLQFRGASLTVQWLLVECEPPRVARWVGSGPAGSRAEISYLLTPLDETTRFDYHNEFTPPFGTLGALAARKLAGVPAREADRSLARLKALAEQERVQPS